MQKRILVLALMVLCLLSAATAQAVDAADPNRFHPGLPEGMDAEWNLLGDRWEIVIDTYATDWDKVASSAGKSGTLSIFPGIIKPDNAVKAKSQSDYMSWNGNINSVESSLQQKLEYQYNNGRGTTYACDEQGWEIGRYDEGSGLFLPTNIPAQQNAGVMVCWWLQNDGGLKTERVRFSVRFTDLVPVYTKPKLVKDTDIEPDPQISNPQIHNGFIRYNLSSGGQNVTTRIFAPSWLDVNNTWSAYLLEYGLETELDIQSRTVGNKTQYYVDVPFQVPAGNSERSDARIHKKDWAIKWVKGNTADVFSLEARFHVKNPDLTVNYLYGDGIEPIPSESMSWSIENPLNAFSASYNETTGIFDMSIHDDLLPPNGKTDLDQTMVDIQLLVPDNAVKCRMKVLQGDVIYGDTGADLQDPMWMENLVPNTMVEIPDLTNLIFLREIPVELPNGKMINYYLAPAGYCDLGGRTLVFDWFDQEGKKVGKTQQITLMTNAYQILAKKSPSLTKNPTVVVKAPTLVTQQSGLEMFYAQMPQSGDQILRYELMLLDKNGNIAIPKKPVTIYLPYPEGMSQDNFVADAFVISHQLKDGSHEEYSVKKGNLLVTPYGLRIEVSTFSPYFMSWEIAPDMAVLPETGDPSALWLCAAMLSISAAGIFAMCKKRKITA